MARAIAPRLLLLQIFACIAISLDGLRIFQPKNFHPYSVNATFLGRSAKESKLHCVLDCINEIPNCSAVTWVEGVCEFYSLENMRSESVAMAMNDTSLLLLGK